MPDLFGSIVKGAINTYKDADNEAARRSQAKLAKAQADAQLKTLPAQTDAELTRLQAATYQTNNTLLQTQTYSAFDRYSADGDARHLNTFLDQAKQNPVGANIYGNYARIDSLGKVRTPEIEHMLKQAGISDIDGFYSDPTLTQQYVITTDTAGNQALMDMDKVYGMTGYTKYQTDQQLAEAQKRAEINRLLQTGVSLSNAQQLEKLAQSIVTNEGLSYADAMEKAKSIMSSSTDTRGIQSIMDENPNLDYASAAEQWYSLKRSGVGAGVMSNEERYIQDMMTKGMSRAEATTAYKNLTATSDQKEVVAINTIKDEIDALNFGTEEKPKGYFDTNISDLPMRDKAKVQRYVADIEKLSGASLTTEDKRVARDIRNLVELGGVAGTELTDEETGLLDKTLNSFKNYIVNEVGGTEATSAYESFRNIFRNALYGASLTPSEIKAFEKSMGGLGQKTMPVLQRLKTQMQSLKTQLETIRDMNDPYVAHYYLGGDVDQVDEMIRALDDRINYVDTVKPTIKPTTTKDIPAVQDGTQTKSLDEIFSDVEWSN